MFSKYGEESYPDQTANESPPPNYAQNEETNPFDDKKVRAAFVRKVFMILSAQLVFTSIIVAIFTFVPAVQQYVVRRGFWLYITSYVIFIVVYLVLVCSKTLTRKFPWNFVALGVLTLAMSLMLGNIAAYHDTFTVVMALGTTVVVCVAITIFSIQTKYDLTNKFTGPLFAALIVLIMFGILGIIFHSKILTVVYASLGALIFSIFLMISIQTVVGGRAVELSEEEYITAALSIYLDIVNLFLMILTLIGAARS